MSLVAHKYTPAEMSDHELESTFAAREHIVDYLVKALRDQMRSGTLSSYVITGPRGAGKSTIIQMVDLRIRQDAALSAAWIPVMFPEEQFNMTSLRDMLAATLHRLAMQNISGAEEWLKKAEAEPDEEQSEQLAITGIRVITRQTGKRLILFIENLDQLLNDYLDDKMKGTLRRLLMSDAFMMIIGSTVHIFDALKNYDEAFFNYFGQVPLDRLNAEQVSELLRKRAEYDRNDRFLRELPKQQAKVKTLVHLTGGNPRFVLMLYELLSLQQVTTIVQQLKRLVDELTPVLKDEMENLPPQQRKIIHALMEHGGTAQPSDLTGPTRLPLNAITTQLKRLKEAQIVDVRGGGKGRAANYTVPDKLFSLWYQMRYLGQNRRRIELFVEVLRVWFEADERIDTLRKLARHRIDASPQALRDSATTAEYLAASLKGSAHARAATEMCVSQWLATDLHEAALAYADLSRELGASAPMAEHAADLGLADWLADHRDFGNVIKALDQAISKSGCTMEQRTRALLNRGVTKGRLGDAQAAIADFTAVIELDGASKERVAWALLNRGVTKGRLGDAQAAIADFTAVIELEGAPKEQVTWALINRGLTKGRLGDTTGEMGDYTAVIELEGAPKEQVANALFNRGFAKGWLGDVQGAMADYTAIIGLEGVPKERIARALINRGVNKHQLGDAQGAMADYTAVIELDGAPMEGIAKALFNRGMSYLATDSTTAALSDLMAVISSGITTDNLMSDAAAAAISLEPAGDIEPRTEHVLRTLSTALESLSNEQAREVVLHFLNALAMPEMKKAWPSVWKSLIAQLKPEVAEAVRFLEPVCSVLEGKDRTLLDALPPEQRDFAVEVLAKFEPTPEPKPAEAKETYGKRTRVKK